MRLHLQNNEDAVSRGVSIEVTARDADIRNIKSKLSSFFSIRGFPFSHGFRRISFILSETGVDDLTTATRSEVGVPEEGRSACSGRAGWKGGGYRYVQTSKARTVGG